MAATSQRRDTTENSIAQWTKAATEAGTNVTMATFGHANRKEWEPILSKLQTAGLLQESEHHDCSQAHRFTYHSYTTGKINDTPCICGKDHNAVNNSLAASKRDQYAQIRQRMANAMQCLVQRQSNRGPSAERQPDSTTDSNTNSDNSYTKQPATPTNPESAYPTAAKEREK